ATSLDADRFRVRDLHMVDVAIVPEGLEDTVAETEHQQVLHRLLAAVVIDAVDLPFGENALNLRIHGLRRFEIMSKRLFNDDAAPTPIRFLCQVVTAELLDDVCKKLWGRR